MTDGPPLTAWSAPTPPSPPAALTPEEDLILLDDYPVVEGQVKFDYGYNCKFVTPPPPFSPSPFSSPAPHFHPPNPPKTNKQTASPPSPLKQKKPRTLTPPPYNTRFGPHVYINNACTFLDTHPITIGARTLIGPNCAFYAAAHPLDPSVRDGTSGPEAGKPITVGEDCWFGGSVVCAPRGDCRAGRDGWGRECGDEGCGGFLWLWWGIRRGWFGGWRGVGWRRRKW